MIKKASLAFLSELGISTDEYKKVIQIIGRKPTELEASVFSALWNEHCSYKSSNVHLKKLLSTGDEVICNHGENAGTIDIGDDQVAIFKIESHNHSSYIEPFQGSATCVGGIIRDTFVMGARPIALLNSFKFGESNLLKTKYYLDKVIEGSSWYGNYIGIPTVGIDCQFNSAYDHNIIVNSMCIGIAKKDDLHSSFASSPNLAVIYLGSQTARDGVYGASMASSGFKEKHIYERSKVQIADPFAGKLLMEACLELMESDDIIAIHDIGAAGITCTAVEMVSKAGLGIELELDKVPLFEQNMLDFEIILSETQERMLMVIEDSNIENAKKIFDKWEVKFVQIGKTNDSGHITLKRNQEKLVELSIKDLTNLEYNHAFTLPEQKISSLPEYKANNCNEILKEILSSPNGCSKDWAYEQYDSTIMNDTICGTDKSSTSIVRVHDTKKALVLSLVSDPELTSTQIVWESWKKICATGAKPLAITNCLNFGNPNNPVTMGQFVATIKSIKEVCEFLDYPVISGDVSLYNETDGKAIPPTPVIVGVGLLEDINKYIPDIFVEEDYDIVLIGPNPSPSIDLKREKHIGQYIKLICNTKRATSCRYVSSKGIYATLAKMAIHSDIGAQIQLEENPKILFGHGGQYILTMRQELTASFIKESEQFEVEAAIIGRTGGKELKLNDHSINLSELAEAYRNTLPSLMNT